MKKILFFSLFVVTQAAAQHYKRAINLEVGGTGLLYQVNYEQFLRNKLAVSAGASFVNIQENQTEKQLTLLTLPVSASLLLPIKQNRHYFEAGLGVMNLLTSGDLIEYKSQTDFYLNPFVKMGYRYVSKNNRWQYKLLFTPFYASKSISNPTTQGFSITGGAYQLWGGMSWGYRF